MSGEFCVSVEDVATAASMTTQAGLAATDELSAGETRMNGGGVDTFRGTANGALGEFRTYLSDRRKSLDTAVDEMVQGLRMAAATFDATEADSRQALGRIQKTVEAQGPSVLKL